MPLFAPRRAALLAASILSLLPVAHAAEMFPFVPPWDDATPSVTNLSGWLDQPAGKDGFVTARDGHFFSGNKRVRFFGVNMAFGGNFPTHADAEKVAARMAKFGINCVRFHHMDTDTAPTGILKKDRRTLDPEALDKLDYFVAQLKKHGIYSNLNLHVGNRYPDMPAWEASNVYFKGVDNYYTPMIEQQKAFAKALLTHVNPYTGKAYIEEPAVCLIEINNENGLIMEWNNGAFNDMPEAYEGELRTLWNAWLTKKYGDHKKLAAVWNEGVEPLGAELLRTAQDAWNFETHEGAVAKREWTAGDSPETPVMHIQVTQPSGQGWHVQTNQGGLKFTGGKTYTVRFRAKADAERRININLSQNHEPWKVLASGEATLTKEWKTYQFSMPVPDSDENARVSLSNLGSAASQFWFSNVSVRQGGVQGLQEGEKLGSIAPLEKRSLGTRPLAAQKDWSEFLVDTETAYWTGMYRYIRDELKAKQPIIGTASGFSPWIIQAQLDAVDSHAYWKHPHFPRKPWDPADWVVENEPMAGAPDGGVLPDLALRRVVGKPFLVTEYNAASPNIYSAEAFLELCAMGGLQDWDAIYVFAYSHRFNQWDTKHYGSFFDIDQHPTKMATLPAAVALFFRGDVQPTGAPTVLETNMQTAMDSIRNGSSWPHAGTYGVPRMAVFQQTLGMRLNPAAQWSVPTVADPAVVRSLNGHLTWDSKAKQMRIAAPRSAGVVGAVKAGEKIELGAVQITPGATQKNWATINATVIDGTDFASAKKVLITATGMSENTGLQWKDASQTSVGTNWGKGPSLVEGIPAKIQLPLKSAKAWALDDKGQRKNEVPVTQAGGQTLLEISSQHQTLWWEVEAN